MPSVSTDEMGNETIGTTGGELIELEAPTGTGTDATAIVNETGIANEIETETGIAATATAEIVIETTTEIETGTVVEIGTEM